MARAISSLPVPVSPIRSTVESLVATVWTSRSTCRRAGLRPTIPSKSAPPAISSSNRSSLFVLAGMPGLGSLIVSPGFRGIHSVRKVAVAPILVFLPFGTCWKIFAALALRAATAAEYQQPHARVQLRCSKAHLRLSLTRCRIGRELLSSLFRNPLADICRAVPQLGTVRFALFKELYCISIHKPHVSQVENQVVIVCFGSKKSPQFRHIFCLDSSTQRQNHLVMFNRSLNSQHRLPNLSSLV